MAKRRNRQNRPAATPSDAARLMRRWAWEAKRDAMAEGRRERAATYADRKRETNRRACRDRSTW